MISRIRFFSLSLLFLVLGSLSVDRAHADPVEAAVTEIRGKYNAIEGAKLRKQTITFEADDGPESGTLTRFFLGNELVKANLSYSLGDHGGSNETYYYSGGQFFFAYVANSYWQFTGQTLPNGESQTEDIMTEDRLYYANMQLIRHLRKEVRSTNPNALGGLLAKAPNQPVQDGTLANGVFARGLQTFGVTSADQLRNLILAQ